MRAYDGLDKMPDILRREVLLEIFGSEETDLSLLLSWIDASMQFDFRRQISRIARLVEKAAENGEIAAQIILATAVNHICDMICKAVDSSVVDKSSYSDFVLIEGSLIESNKYIASAIRSVVTFLLPRAQIVYPAFDSVVGLHMYALAGDEQIPFDIRRNFEEQISILPQDKQQWLLLRGSKRSIIEDCKWPWNTLPYWLAGIECGKRPPCHWDRETP